MKQIGYLYINGLGNGQTKLHGKLAVWWWRRAGVELHHAHVNWFDGASAEAKINDTAAQASELLKKYDALVLIGSSAGGSLALNSFYRLRDENVRAVIAHGRLKEGKLPRNSRNSLVNRAGASQSFFDNVKLAEDRTVPALDQEDKKRLLVLTQLTDMVVPMHCMVIEGVLKHRSFAFGHSGGFLAHLLADRNLIIRFANQKLH